MLAGSTTLPVKRSGSSGVLHDVRVLGAVAIGVLELLLGLFGDLAAALVLLVVLPVACGIIVAPAAIAGAIASALGLWTSQVSWLGSVLVFVGLAIGLVLGIRLLLATVHTTQRVLADLRSDLESAGRREG